MHAIVQACAEAWHFLIGDPERIRSIATRSRASVTVWAGWYNAGGGGCGQAATEDMKALPAVVMRIEAVPPHLTTQAQIGDLRARLHDELAGKPGKLHRWGGLGALVGAIVASYGAGLTAPALLRQPPTSPACGPGDEEASLPRLPRPARTSRLPRAGPAWQKPRS